MSPDLFLARARGWRLLDSMRTEASFSPNLTDLLRLQLAQVPRFGDILVDNSNDNDTYRSIKHNHSSQVPPNTWGWGFH